MSPGVAEGVGRGRHLVPAAGHLARAALVGYAYPWDVVADPAEADRYAELGLDAACLPISYHGVRTITRRGTRVRITDLPESVTTMSPEESDWRGRRVSPWRSGAGGRDAPTEADDTFLPAQRTLRRAGLRSYAWSVGVHDSRLARRFPELAAHSAWSQPMTRALCPNQPEVMEYLAHLIGTTAQRTGCTAIVVESVGAAGILHAAAHDKTDFAELDGVTTDLLSICWCSACECSYVDAGMDVAHERKRIRLASADRNLATEVRSSAEFSQFAKIRIRATSSVVMAMRATLSRTAPSTRLIVHANSSDFSTGAFAALPNAGTMADLLCAPPVPPPVRGPSPDLLAWQHRRPDRPVGAVIDLRHARRGSVELLAQLETATAAGASELHLYHVGLQPQEHVAATRAALRQYREQRTTITTSTTDAARHA